MSAVPTEFGRRSVAWVVSRAGPLAVASALLIGLPALSFGFHIEEELQLAVLDRAGQSNVLMNHWKLWCFEPAASSRERAESVKLGLRSWWLLHEPVGERMCFFRPLASALFRIDHALFGRRALGYHAVSIVWFGLLVAVLAGFYRSLFEKTLGSSALGLFVIASVHAEAIELVCARHILIAAVFGLLGFLAHTRGRMHGWRPGWALAILCFGLSLLAGETGLQMIAYVVAYEGFGSSDRPMARLRRAFPFVAMALLYIGWYGRSGHGATLMQYVDPLHDPRAALTSFGQQFPALFSEIVLGLQGLSLFTPPRWAILLALLALGIVALALPSALRTLPRRDALHVRALGIGALLTLVPACFAQPGLRILLAPSIGSTVVIAVIVRFGFQVARDAWAELLSQWRRRLVVAIGALLCLSHGVWGFASFPVQYVVLRAVARASLDPLRHLQNPFVRNRALDAVLVVAPPADFRQKELNWVGPSSASPRWWALTPAPGAHRVVRTANNALEIAFDPAYVASLESRTRGAWSFERVRLGSGTVHVLETRNGHPIRIRVELDRALDDRRWQVLSERGGSLQPFELAAVGERVTLPAKSYELAKRPW